MRGQGPARGAGPVAAAAPPGVGPQSDVRDTARLGLHLLRKAGSRLDRVRRVLDGAADAAAPSDARSLGAELDSAATAPLGPGGGTTPDVHAAAPGAAAAGSRRRPRRVGRRRGGGRRHPARRCGAASAVDRAADARRRRQATVSPASAGCNTTFAFVASGSLSGTGTLVYRWEQSDGQVTSAPRCRSAPTRARSS